MRRLTLRRIQLFWTAMFVVGALIVAGCGPSVSSGRVIDRRFNEENKEYELLIHGLSPSGRQEVEDWVEVSQGTYNECLIGNEWKQETGCDGVEG